MLLVLNIGLIASVLTVARGDSILESIEITSENACCKLWKYQIYYFFPNGNTVSIHLCHFLVSNLGSQSTPCVYNVNISWSYY